MSALSHSSKSSSSSVDSSSSGLSSGSEIIKRVENLKIDRADSGVGSETSFTMRRAKIRENYDITKIGNEDDAGKCFDCDIQIEVTAKEG